MSVGFTVFKARKEDFNFPCVWVNKEDAPTQGDMVCVYRDSKKIYVQCRTIDDTLDTHKAYQDIKLEQHPILMSEHYRKKLDIQGEKNIDFRKIKNIHISYAGKYKSFIYGIFCAWQHPEVYARISLQLGLCGLVLGIISLGLWIVNLVLLIIILALLVYFYE